MLHNVCVGSGGVCWRYWSLEILREVQAGSIGDALGLGGFVILLVRPAPVIVVCCWCMG